MSKGFKQVATTAERLKMAMELRGKKQIDLVKEAGIDKGSISHYLSGRYEPKSDAINRLAIVLNCSEMWLWGYDVPMERQKNSPPENKELTEGEKMLLELFNKVPEDKQSLVLEMIRAALKTQK